MPASTSSNISVGVNEALLVITLIAKLMRANSPPEATFANERGVLPAWPATKNSICSRPWDPPSMRGVRPISSRPPAMDKSCIASVTNFPRSDAAFPRFCESSLASLR